MRFWTNEKIEKVKVVIKKSKSLVEAAHILSTQLNRRISPVMIRHALWRYARLRAKDMLLPDSAKFAHVVWHKEDAEKIVKFLNSSATFEDAKHKISAHFGKSVTYDGVKGILARHGIRTSIGDCLSQSTETRSTRRRSDWTKGVCDQTIAILGKHYTLSSALTEMGEKLPIPVSMTALRDALKDHYGPFATPTQFLKQSKDTSHNDELINKIIKFLKRNKKKRISFRDLCDEFDKAPTKMEAVIKEAVAYGYKLDFNDDCFCLNTELPEIEKLSPSINIPDAESNRIRLGVISDTHFGSKAVLKEEIKNFINVAYDEFGVRTILHCGDILAGNHVYKGQAAELSHWTCQEQCEEACLGLPELKGLSYVAILGNHDVDFIKSAGIDVGYVLASMRKDLNVIGTLQQKFLIKNFNVQVELVHIKSSAHARSYSVEKHIYKTITKTNQPDVVFSGHRHVNGYFEVQGVHTFLVPCFEDANLFVHYNDFMPSVGGLIVDFVLDKNNEIIRCEPSFHLYRKQDKNKINISTDFIDKKRVKK